MPHQRYIKRGHALFMAKSTRLMLNDGAACSTHSPTPFVSKEWLGECVCANVCVKASSLTVWPFSICSVGIPSSSAKRFFSDCMLRWTHTRTNTMNIHICLYLLFSILRSLETKWSKARHIFTFKSPLRPCIVCVSRNSWTIKTWRVEWRINWINWMKLNKARQDCGLSPIVRMGCLICCLKGLNNFFHCH